MKAIAEHIESLKAAGYRVFAPVTLTSYFYVTDGTNIAYCQHSKIEGITYSSVHMPNQYSGTGYKADSLNDALGYKPAWAYRDNVSILKYKGIEHFCSKHWQALIEQ